MTPWAQQSLLLTWKPRQELSPHAALVKFLLACELVVIPVLRALDRFGVTETCLLQRHHRIQRKRLRAFVVEVHVHLHVRHALS